MARVKATAGFTVYPIPAHALRDREASRPGNKTWARSAIMQDRSILFSKISAEIRAIIYRYVLSIHDDRFIIIPQQVHKDPTHCHNHLRLNGQIHRPPPRKRGYNQHSLDMVLTCQAVYAETCDLAVSMNSHILLYPAIRALSFPLPSQAREYFSRMTVSQIEQVKHIHLFVGSNRFKTSYYEPGDLGGYRSETPFAELGMLRNGSGSNPGRPLMIPYMPIHPLTMTITVRGYDWSQLYIYPPGDNRFTLTRMFLRNKKWEAVFGSLRCLTIELEVETQFKESLKNDIKDLTDFKFDVGNNKKLEPLSTFEEATWRQPLTEDEKVSTTADGREGEEDDMSEESDISEFDTVVPDATKSQPTHKEFTVFIIRWNLVSGKD